jgi:hypothetical protein
MNKITNEEHKQHCALYSDYINAQLVEIMLGKLRDMWQKKETTILYKEPFNKADYQDVIPYASVDLIRTMREKCWFAKSDEVELQMLTFQWHARLYKFRSKIEQFAREMQDHEVSFSMQSPQEAIDDKKYFDDLAARGLVDEEGYELTEDGERIVRYKNDKKYTKAQWDEYLKERKRG